MKSVSVFGEIYSKNLGDRIIFDSIKYCFNKYDIDTYPVDLSGRIGWQDTKINKVKKKSLCRNFARKMLASYRSLRRFHSASSWYLGSRKNVIKYWNSVIRSSDAVVIGGGQLLTDINFGFPPKIYEVARIAISLNKPFALFGCGVGKEWGYLASTMYRYVFNNACYVGVRDNLSASFLCSNKLDHLDVHVLPDVAFIAGHALSVNNLVSSEKNIGFNFQHPVSFRNFVPELRNVSDDAFIKFWVKLIAGAINSGYSPLIITNGDELDFEFSKIVVNALKFENFEVALNQRPTRPEHLIESISNISILICTRMHAGITAFSLGKKVVPISWDKKVDGVWDYVGLGHLVVPAIALLHEDPWSFFKEKIVNNEIDSNRFQLICKDIITGSGQCIEALRDHCR
jgi:polysaccharide pyruvyl transferase WcaK-like protein